MQHVSVVLPCYNEEGRLHREAFSEFLQHEPDVDLLFVDDGSTDGTAAALEELRTSGIGPIDVVTLDRNRGKAEAVRRGMLRAMEGGAQFVGYWDSDLATPLADVPVFARILESRPQLEVVFGSRVRLMGRQIDRRPSRHYFGRVFATVVSLMLGLPIYDTQCGAKLFRVTPRLKHIFDEPFHSRWVFDVEILFRLMTLARQDGGLPVESLIYEHPLIEWTDVPGSKINLWAYARSALDLAAMYRHYASGRWRPGASSGRH